MMWILSACTNREQRLHKRVYWTLHKFLMYIAQTIWRWIPIYCTSHVIVTGNVEDVHALEMDYAWLCMTACSFPFTQKRKSLWGCSFIAQEKRKKLDSWNTIIAFSIAQIFQVDSILRTCWSWQMLEYVLYSDLWLQTCWAAIKDEKVFQYLFQWSRWGILWPAPLCPLQTHTEAGLETKSLGPPRNSVQRNS